MPAKKVIKPRERGETVVTIRALVDGKRPFEAPIERGAPLERLAEEWSYVLRSRPRWADKMDVRRTLRARALDDLRRCGIGRPVVKKLTSAQHVEVELHSWDASDSAANNAHEAAAEIPWEYLLSAATRAVGRFRPMLITRLFRNKERALIPGPPKRVLFIESKPGRLEDDYDFQDERQRIQAAVDAVPVSSVTSDYAGATIDFSETETVSELTRRVRRSPLDAIHVSGVDTHQVTQFIKDLYVELRGNEPLWKRITTASDRVRDGMILRDRNIAELPVPYRELADIIVDPKEPPDVVTLNLYHSGARTARELVRRGAHAALGFLDEIDDELAELFFQALYWAWCRPGGAFGIPQAFMQAWHELKKHGDRLHGTAIAIWFGKSVFEPQRYAGRAPSAQPDTEAAPPTRPASQAETPIDKLLQVEFDPEEEEINYSLLHNDRPLLKKLTLTKLVKESLHDVTVLVELDLGSQNYPFRLTQTVLSDPQLAIAPLVRIPLTAALPRSLRERVKSTVYVKVCCGGRTAYENTKRVTLIPVDEWLDDTDNNPWLPSFVLPRDPAVLRIIESARRYLIGICDDPAAGFDGYQSVDENADDPTAGVDNQVRAIWTALVNEYRLQYINPPPAYSDRTQRLRTPSDILESRSGTCVDLALLLASCLEYVDIYPIIVLLEGHAFAGYWRSAEFHEAFTEVQRVPATVPAVGGVVARKTGVPFVDTYGWRLTRMHYDEIMMHLTSGELVMLEATYLTSASSFADGMDEGRANMRSRRQFDSLLDIRLARTASPPVTPLPIIIPA